MFSSFLLRSKRPARTSLQENRVNAIIYHEVSESRRLLKPILAYALTNEVFSRAKRRPSGAPKGGAAGAMAPPLEADFTRISPLSAIFIAEFSILSTRSADF